MEQPTELSTYPQQAVPGHVVVLSFNDDTDVIYFSEWWNTIGYQIFKHYAELAS
jgi:hypothetical protein